MIVNVWLIVDPSYDRPFVSTRPPPATLQRGPNTQVLRYELQVPEPVPVDAVLSTKPTESP
jgi:hypothetical protein